MDDWFSFKTTTRGQTIGVDAKIESDPALSDLTVHMEITTDVSKTVTMKMDINTSVLTIQGLLGLPPLTACLAACAVGATVGPLISCLNKNIKQYVACLKSKGLDAASDIVKCAIACLAGIP